jgi:hypothetical protein
MRSRSSERMAAAHWQVAAGAFVMLSRMICPDESVTPLRKSSCEQHGCNNALEKDGVEGGLG